MTNSLKRRSVDPRQLCLISNIRCIDRVETCRTSNIAIITLGLRSFDKTVEERIHLVHVKLLTLTQELLLLVVIHVVPGVEHMALPGLLELLSDGVHVGRPVVKLRTAVFCGSASSSHQSLCLILYEETICSLEIFEL